MTGDWQLRAGQVPYPTVSGGGFARPAGISPAGGSPAATVGRPGPTG